MNLFFVYKQKTAYEMRISDWSSDVCSSDPDDRVERAPDHRLPHLQTGQPLVLALEPVDLVALSAERLRQQDARDRQRLLGHGGRSEERRVGKACAVRVDLGGRRLFKKKNYNKHKLYINRSNKINNTI